MTAVLCTLIGVLFFTIPVAYLYGEKRGLGKRPRLQPGEVVTFYDSTRLIPAARLVVQEYSVSREWRRMHLVGQEELLKHHIVRDGGDRA